MYIILVVIGSAKHIHVQCKVDFRDTAVHITVNICMGMGKNLARFYFDGTAKLFL